MRSFRLARLAAEARRLWERLDARGTTWLVGGAVRDLALGLVPQDVDLATALLPRLVQEVADAAGHRTIAVGQEFGRIGVVTAAGVVDVTTFREESGYQDGRHPARVRFTTDGVRDLMRRDFTINAMALTAGGDLIDPAGGMSDLSAGVIRAVGNPHQRLRDDHLRILRALRLLAYDPGTFDLAADLESAMMGRSVDLGAVAAARKGAEWAAILRHPWPDRAIAAGARCRLWAPWEYEGRMLAELVDPAARLLALETTYDMRQLGVLEWPRALRVRAKRIGRMLTGQDPPSGEEGMQTRSLAAWLGRPDPAILLRGGEIMELFHLQGRAVGRVMAEQRRLCAEAGDPWSREALTDRLGRFVENLKQSSD